MLDMDTSATHRVRRPTDVDVRIGQHLRARRMLLGMSQEKLGERLGLTFQQIQKYEKGVNRISVSRLIDLCRAVDCSIPDFFAELENAPETSAAQASIEAITAFEGSAKAVKSLSRLSQPKRRAVLDLIEALAASEAPAP